MGIPWKPFIPIPMHIFTAGPFGLVWMMFFISVPLPPQSLISHFQQPAACATVRTYARGNMQRKKLALTFKYSSVVGQPVASLRGGARGSNCLHPSQKAVPEIFTASVQIQPLTMIRFHHLTDSYGMIKGAVSVPSGKIHGSSTVCLNNLPWKSD